MYKNINQDNAFHELVPVAGATHKNLTVTDSATDLGSFNDKTKYVLVTVNAESIRFTLDGSTPTASDGHLLSAGASLTLFSLAQAKAMKVIRGGSNNANVCVSELTR